MHKVVSQLGGVITGDGRVVLGNMPACYQVEKEEVLSTVAVEDVQVKMNVAEPMEGEYPRI